MTVRYTAVEGMDDPALRDLDRNAERWRDKIELRLDNRQVFFLFFGSAVVACMLFVLGVMVGKRIESRGQAAAPEMQDPLAALDRAHKPASGADAPAPELTFPNTLIAPATKAKAAKPAAPPAPKPAVAAPAKPAAPVAAPRPAVPPAAPPRSVAPAAAPSRPTAPAAAADPAPTAKAKGKYTLQLSTFASAQEANAFAQRYPGAFVIGGEVPGRGVAYRVRYGNFPTYKDATSAKDSFEKQHNLIALVAAR
ncbi:MAG TPA: SPOR domain-containing protein [Polyangia bacterium]|nr:SPOR domain-containing protein [Polyangia bacterium]